MEFPTILDANNIREIIKYGDKNTVDFVALSHEQPIFLVFLRHFGCTFCREALYDISQVQGDIKSKGIKLVFVHMSDMSTAEKFFKRNNLKGEAHISDPECRLYAHFGLTKGTFSQLFGLRVWMRGAKAGFIEGKGHGFRYIGDGFQMPGLFMIRKGEIISSYIHDLASDRPDYNNFIECAI